MSIARPTALKHQWTYPVLKDKQEQETINYKNSSRPAWQVSRLSAADRPSWSLAEFPHEWQRSPRPSTQHAQRNNYTHIHTQNAHRTAMLITTFGKMVAATATATTWKHAATRSLRHTCTIHLPMPCSSSLIGCCGWSSPSTKFTSRYTFVLGILASEGWREAWQPSTKLTRSY